MFEEVYACKLNNTLFVSAEEIANDCDSAKFAATNDADVIDIDEEKDCDTIDNALLSDADDVVIAFANEEDEIEIASLREDDAALIDVFKDDDVVNSASFIEDDAIDIVVANDDDVIASELAKEDDVADMLLARDADASTNALFTVDRLELNEPVAESKLVFNTSNFAARDWEKNDAVARNAAKSAPADAELLVAVEESVAIL